MMLSAEAAVAKRVAATAASLTDFKNIGLSCDV
jgi:hypothetical protein